MEIFKTVENNKEIQGIFYYPPDDRRCTATSKQTGERCKRWTVKGKKVCHFHGGRSRGSKTAQGIENIRQAHLKTGKYALDKLKTKMLNRIGKTLYEQRAPSWIYKYLQQKFDAMNYQTFRNQRLYLIAFIHGKISMKELATYLDGKVSP